MFRPRTLIFHPRALSCASPAPMNVMNVVNVLRDVLRSPVSEVNPVLSIIFSREQSIDGRLRSARYTPRTKFMTFMMFMAVVAEFGDKLT
jgi:hypothetical protein